ncbi:hypothetical protein B0T26DRAFT_539387 [Lasiosphaeria miniovina]|uniref:Fungal-type protein kinase domain-containing protein n=1 Tax=Lasiosphaeria miniovina TaxID=1954250 RepID=A0AA39ZQY7_9PEZI|nr:uncharacterized protein B0T26DRAFT_539387 [Lasiosphaeria miniovina]KAK0702046.1 hypothetical protein B0T26DRAFT_539387 [Lasiosphaeria miniovina]
MDRVGASGAKWKTGTRAFMAIGALLGEQHSFMHDLESFFWVLFWIFIKSAKNNFTPYHQPLIPWVNRLRKAVFPNGGSWEREDGGLYVRMRQILQEAQEDLSPDN